MTGRGQDSRLWLACLRGADDGPTATFEVIAVRRRDATGAKATVRRHRSMPPIGVGVGVAARRYFAGSDTGATRIVNRCATTASATSIQAASNPGSGNSLAPLDLRHAVTR